MHLLWESRAKYDSLRGQVQIVELDVDFPAFLHNTSWYTDL